MASSDSVTGSFDLGVVTACLLGVFRDLIGEEVADEHPDHE
jgi:hypothetical protein